MATEAKSSSSEAKKTKNNAKGRKGSVIGPPPAASAAQPPAAAADKKDGGKEKAPPATTTSSTTATPNKSPTNKRRSLLMILRRDNIRADGNEAAAMEIVDAHHGSSGGSSGSNSKKGLTRAANDDTAAANNKKKEANNKEKKEKDKKTTTTKENAKEKEKESEAAAGKEKEAEKDKEKEEEHKEKAKEKEDARPSVGEAHLLDWCRQQTEAYAGVAIEDFQASWRDGLAFCALVHRFRPGAFDFASLQPDNADANLKLAFATAEKELGVPSYLSSEDVADSDGADVLTYLLKFHSLVETNENAAAGTSSCVILAEPTLNASGNVAEPAQVLATLASSRPRLASPKRAGAAAGRRPPTRGVRPGDKISVKESVENKKGNQDNTVFCMEGDPDQLSVSSPRKRGVTMNGSPVAARAVASSAPNRARKGTAPPPLEKSPTTLNRASATSEGDVEMPEWKRKLIEKKRLKAAAEAAKPNGGQAPPAAGQAGDAKPADEGDSECQMMEGFLFKRDGERWVRKWFVLNGPHLVYYGDKRTEKNQLSPQGILSLELVSAVAPFTDKANGIEITDHADGTYQVYASSRGEYELWLDALKGAQAKHAHQRLVDRSAAGSDSRRGSASTWSNIASAAKEGELMMLPGKGLGSIIGGRKWKKAYVIVKDGFLERCEAKGAKPKLRVPLIKCEFAAHEDRTQKHAFRVATAKKKLFLAAPDDDDMHAWMDALLKQRRYLEQAIDAIAAAAAASSPPPESSSAESNNRGRRNTNDGEAKAEAGQGGGGKGEEAPAAEQAPAAAKDKGKEKTKP